MKGEALAAATEADRTLTRSPTMAAIARYTGVLYDALDVATLPTQDQARLHRQVIIFSGLWGALMPNDPIPDYKLKMGASLPSLGRLSRWWRHPVTAALAPVVEDRVVWDLLPKEHSSAWAPPPAGSADPGAPAARLTVRFLDEQPGAGGGEPTFASVNHWNKLLKGALVRYVLATGADDPEALVRFDHPQGYALRPSLTEQRGDQTIVAMVRPPRR